MLNTMQRWWRTRGTDIYTDVHVPLEFHGSDYGGWAIAADSLSADSVVLSFGIGEDVTFDEAIIGKRDSARVPVQHLLNRDHASLRLHSLKTAGARTVGTREGIAGRVIHPDGFDQDDFPCQ